MQSIFFITIILFLLSACAAPTVTATIPPTIALTATPSFTETPTLSPEQAEQMKAIDELIASWGVDASKWNYSYNTKTGELGIYLAKNAFLGLGGEIKLTLADGSVVDLNSTDVVFDEEGELQIAGYNFDEKTGEWVEAVVEGVASVELHGNKFSGEKIYLTAEKFTENPTLSQADLPAMREYILQLYADGQIRQFADGAMQLGTGDLEMSPDSFKSDATTQTMFSVPDEDFKSKKWKDRSLRPVVPMVFPAVENGGRWAPEIWLQKDGTPNVVWYLQPVGWDNVKWDTTTIVKMMTEYDPMSQGGNALPLPIDFKTIDACKKYTWTPDLDEICADLVNNRTKSRTLLSNMVKGGMIPVEIQNGEVFFIPVFQRIVASN